MMTPAKSLSTLEPLGVSMHFIYALLAFTLSANAQLSQHTLNYAGAARTYELFVPSSYRANTAMPLVLVFHPNHGTGRGMERITDFSSLAASEGFLVAYPDSDPGFSDGRGWKISGANNDVEFAMAVKADIQAVFNVAANKIYIAGFSLGGGLVQALACAHGASFAGAGVVSDNLNPQSEGRCGQPSPIAYVLFHGTADPIRPYHGGANGTHGGQTYSALETAQYWAKVNGCKKQPRSQRFADHLDNRRKVSDILQTWNDCSKPVRFYTITGGGHTWPGGDTASSDNGPTSQGLNASKTIWNNLTGKSSGPETAN